MRRWHPSSIASGSSKPAGVSKRSGRSALPMSMETLCRVEGCTRMSADSVSHDHITQARARPHGVEWIASDERENRRVGRLEHARLPFVDDRDVTHAIADERSMDAL